MAENAIGKESPMSGARKWIAAALLAAAAGGPPAALVADLAPEARASVPAGPPVFSDPRDFDNPFFPFEEGGARVFAGRSEGARVLTIDSFLEDTRDFDWGGGTVACAVLREMEFEDGELVEISWNYFAEADDGSVYYFGEVVDNYEDGAVVDNDGSWLVGSPSGSDPEGTDAVTDPALFMPGNPEVGDVFKPEDVPDGPEEEDTVARTGVKVKTAVGTLEGCIEVHEHDIPDDDYETKWYAPGIGVVKGKAKGEAFALIATTLSPAEAE